MLGLLIELVQAGALTLFVVPSKDRVSVIGDGVNRLGNVGVRQRQDCVKVIDFITIKDLGISATHKVPPAEVVTL